MNSGKQYPKKKDLIFIIKLVHTIIYVAMVWAVFFLLYAAITKSYDFPFWVALGLLLAESVVFAASGMKCPLTSLAKKYGDPKGYVGDLFIPEKYAKYTFRVFGSLFFLAIIILIINILGIR